MFNHVNFEKFLPSIQTFSRILQLLIAAVPFFRAEDATSPGIVRVPSRFSLFFARSSRYSIFESCSRYSWLLARRIASPVAVQSCTASQLQRRLRSPLRTREQTLEQRNPIDFRVATGDAALRVTPYPPGSWPRSCPQENVRGQQEMFV